MCAARGLLVLCIPCRGGRETLTIINGNNAVLQIVSLVRSTPGIYASMRALNLSAVGNLFKGETRCRLTDFWARFLRYGYVQTMKQCFKRDG